MSYLKKNSNPSILLHREGGPHLRCTEPFERVISTIPEDCLIPSSLILLGLLSRHLEPKSDSYEVKTENISYKSISQTTVPPETLKRVRWFLYHHTADLSDKEKKKIGELCSSSGLNQPPESGTTNSKKIEFESVTTVPESVFNTVISESFECKYCGTKYESKASLYGHLGHCKQKTRSKQSSNSENKKEYTCEDCDKSFKRKSLLIVHQKKHCDEKPSEDDNSSGDSSKQSSGKSSKSRPSFGKKIRKDRGSERVSGRNPFADPDRLKDTGLHQGGG